MLGGVWAFQLSCSGIPRVLRCLETCNKRKTSCRTGACRQICYEGSKKREIPCMLVFSCSSKAKINRLKELLESKIRR